MRREEESKRREDGASPGAAAQDPASLPGTPPDAGAGARADAFVSYARRDEPFVRSVLVDALVGRGKEVWLDVKDIPPAADWRERIRAGIEAARAFVFVISADSATSKPCLDELRQAGELNKPLIVVVREDVPRERLPSALEPVEWIFMRESDALEDGIDEVMAALEVDLAWRDLHNELAVRSREWEREGRDGALLLRGRALAEAEQWQSDPGPHRESPTPEQTAYIQAGRQAAGRRTRMLVGGVTTALAVSLALAAFAFVQRGQAVSRERTATSLALASASSRELRGNLGSSLVLGLEALHARATPNARDAMISALEKARRNGLEAVLCCHKGALDSLAFSPDGKTAAAGADNGTVLLWDLDSRRLLARIEQAHETAVRSLAFTPDGKKLASGSAESVRLWDTRTGQALGQLGGSKGTGADALAFGPDGHTLAAGRGGVFLWDTRSPDRAGLFVGGAGGVTHAVAFSPDGRGVAFDSYTEGKYGGGGIMVAHVDPKDHHPLPSGTGGEATALALRGGRLEVAYPDGTVDLGLGSSGPTLRVGHAISSAAFAPGGRYLAVGGSDGTTEVWDVRKRKRVSVLGGHSGPVERVAFASDGLVAAAGDDGTVTLWSVGKQRPLGLPLSRRTGVPDEGYDPQVGVDTPAAFAFSRDGERLANVDGSRVVIRDASSGEPTLTIPARATGLAFGRDGRTLVLAGDRSSIRDTTDGRRVSSLATPGTIAVVAPDGTVVTGGFNGIEVRDPQGRDHAVAESNGAPCIAVSPDGHTLAAAGGGGLLLWDMGRLDRKPRAIEAGGALDCVAFSPDGRQLATAGMDGTVRLWNTRTWQQRGAPLFRYAGPPTKLSSDILSGVINDLGPVGGVAFSPDGSMLASVHGDGTMRLWDVATGGQLGATIVGRDGAFEGVGFSPDGRALATSGIDGVVRLWQGFLWSDFSDLRSQVCALVIGSLSRADWNRFAPGLAYRSTCGS